MNSFGNGYGDFYINSPEIPWAMMSSFLYKMWLLFCSCKGEKKLPHYLAICSRNYDTDVDWELINPRAITNNRI